MGRIFWSGGLAELGQAPESLPAIMDWLEGRDLIRRRLYTPGELLRIGQLSPEHGPNGPPSGAGQPTRVGGGS